MVAVVAVVVTDLDKCSVENRCRRQKPLRGGYVTYCTASVVHLKKSDSDDRGDQCRVLWFVL